MVTFTDSRSSLRTLLDSTKSITSLCILLRVSSYFFFSSLRVSFCSWSFSSSSESLSYENVRNYIRKMLFTCNSSLDPTAPTCFLRSASSLRFKSSLSLSNSLCSSSNLFLRRFSSSNFRCAFFNSKSASSYWFLRSYKKFDQLL
jgi:hypothetical protein